MSEELAACALEVHRADITTLGLGIIVLFPWDALVLRDTVLERVSGGCQQSQESCLH